MASRNRFDQDEILETPFNWDQVKRVFKYVGPYKHRLVRIAIVMIVSQAINLLSPMIFQRAMDVAIPNKDYAYLYTLSGIYVAILIVVALCSRYRIKALSYTGQEMITDIRYDMYYRLQQLPFTYFDSRPHGKISTRVVNYVNTVSDLISNVLVNVIVELSSLIIILIYMFLVDVQLTLYAMLGVPLLVIYLAIIKKYQRRSQQIRNNKVSNINAYNQESVQGMKITQLFGREGVNRQIYHGLGNQVRKSFMDVNIINFSMMPVVEAIANFTTVFLYAAAVFWVRQANGAPLEIGTIIAFVGYVGFFWGPISNLANYYNQILDGASYIERIFEFLDEPLIIEDAEDAYEMPKVKGEVEFRNVSFSYEDDKPVLKNVSFKVNPGESVALVGPTGAGKSTIVNLISRFYDVDSGEVLLDGNNVEKVTIDSLRSQLGIMMQDPYLWPTTIMENIRYGRLDATDEEVIAAAKAVHAHEFIMKQADGYNTEIQERGSGVSAGEKQLISIARVLLADPALIILDEATSSIDTQTEKALQLGLEELTKGRTTFSIAHRLSTIRNADKIFYIAEQGIAEQGKHDELLLQGGYYAKLYEQQIREMLEAGQY